MVDDMPGCHPDGPRNIVLLSDGTGNSAASVWRTNVWRMYEALDLSSGSQLALYDNGVGTSTFRPLAVLGGALGWGLKRNVRDLYTFVCRNYRPQGDGRPHADRIYALGFSRGAFTVRVLVDLIGDQGLVVGVTGRELDRRAKWAYREYRRNKYTSRLHIVSVFRGIRDVALRLWEWRKPRYQKKDNRGVRVAFMGLWDTVDAYGLPIDEMTRGWDQWVWPLKMDSHTPPAHVDKICHAVALDDERHTFHPVLIDEAGLEEKAHTREEQVTQVWFAGVHSNVGGSYPDDSLAHVPLRWMADEACKRGLRLHKVYTDVWVARSDPHGPIYDSRRGLASYYRYNPRSIERLTNDEFAHVSIPRPKIHCSVFQRIAAGRDEYAPIVLPRRYAVVDDDGAIVDFDARFENQEQAHRRALAQERVWDRVWIRRVLYFATVITTVLVVIPPLFLGESSEGILRFPFPHSRFLANVVELLGGVVPGPLQFGIDFYRTKPHQLVIPAIFIGLLMLASSRVERAGADRMRAIWTRTGALTEPNGAIYALRTARLYRRAFQVVTQHIFPFVFGMLALGIASLGLAGTANRAAFTLANAAGLICAAPSPSERPLQRVVDSTPPQEFSNADPCFFTDIQLERGVTYRAAITIGRKDAQGGFVETGQWYDKGQLVTGPEGFSTGDNVFVAPALPFRRVLTARWFVPIIRVGDYDSVGESYGVEYYLLNDKTFVEFTPQITGRVMLFVNDAVGPLPWWTSFYENNNGGENGASGIGQVTITRVETSANAARPPAGSAEQ